MKYNTTYKPHISLKETIKESQNLKKNLINFFSNRYSLLEVDLPDFYEEDSDLITTLPIISRNIASDISKEYKTVFLPLSSSNWIRDLIEKISLNNNEGVYAFDKTIWRDVKESPTQTTANHELVFQIKISSDIATDKLIETTQELYSFIKSQSDFLAKKYNFVQIYPNEVEFYKAQYLENEMPNNTPSEREEYHIIDQDAFILSRISERLYSGKFHKLSPIDLYDLKRCNQIILKDRVNTSPLNVALIAIMANGVQLSDQLNLYGSSHLLSNEFHKKLVTQKHKIMEIRINLPKLMMAILAKGHISEVQPGVISDESEMIRTRYKVSKY